MILEELRNDLIIRQKKGLPFIYASVIIWILITIVILLKLPIYTTNLLIFCCSCPLIPIAYVVGKINKIDIFDKSNPLSKLGFLFTLNQLIYLLIVMWVFNAVPEKMVMVYAMVYGAHLLPYSWLYKSNSYKIFSIIIPVLALILGNIYPSFVLTMVIIVLEIAFLLSLNIELKKVSNPIK